MVVYGRIELDSHAATTFAGENFYILQYTGKWCDIFPYYYDYEAVKFILRVYVENDWKLPDTGQRYILGVQKSLCMGDTLYHTLFNPNQLHNYGTQVQYNTRSEIPLSIITKYWDFIVDF